MLVPDRQLLNGEEIVKCKEDFLYFAEKYLRILDKNSKLVPFKLKPAQIKLVKAIDNNPWQLVLKARQLGSSTLIAALFFWKTLFTPNERTLVVAHTSAGVKNIFRIYQQFYDALPPFLQFSRKNDSANEIVFFHGGTIRVSSASGQSFRGATYNNLHCSEVAFWKDMSQTVAGLFQTAGENSCIILETTANGLNQFHVTWTDDTNGYDKTFLSWTDETEYVLRGIEIEVPLSLQEYGKEHKLSKAQLAWAAQTLSIKCAGSFQTFQQEYAIDPFTCFVSTGSRFFDKVYPNATISTGYLQYTEPHPHGVYVLGSDVASGSPNGDYSAFAILDVTDPIRPIIAATHLCFETPIQFGRRVLEECKKWNALAVIENNSYGLTVVEVLREKEWAKIYTNQKYDTLTKTYTEKLGFTTSGTSRPILLSRLQQAVNSGQLIIEDARVQAQCNSFAYDAAGRPDHMHGKHDDLIFSVGLALMGVDQAFIERYSERRPMPRSGEERMQLEMRTGRSIKALAAEGYFEDEKEDESLIVQVPW